MPYINRIVDIIRCLIAGNWVESKLLNPYQAAIINEMASAGMSSATAAGYLLKFIPQGDVRAELQSQVNDALKAEHKLCDDVIMGVA